MPKKRDARRLPHATLEGMRRLAVRRVMCGESQVAVARSLEVHAGSVWKWVAEFRANGEAGLASTKATGRPSKLSPEQQVELRRIIVGSNPRQLSFGTALWTLPIIRQLIFDDETGVHEDGPIGTTWGGRGERRARPDSCRARSSAWGHLKRMSHEDPIDVEEDFLDAVKTSMDEIKKRRDLVRGFFNHPEATYVREAQVVTSISNFRKGE